MDRSHTTLLKQEKRNLDLKKITLKNKCTQPCHSMSHNILYERAKRQHGRYIWIE
jgi:hypothetical protein